MSEERLQKNGITFRVEHVTGYSPSQGKVITVDLFVDTAFDEFHPELMGDKNMGYTPEQEAEMAAQSTHS